MDINDLRESPYIGFAEGQGRLEIGELYRSIKPQVERVARRTYNNEQTPQVIGSRKLMNLRLIQQ